jgi:hypothetical protein
LHAAQHGSYARAARRFEYEPQVRCPTGARGLAPPRRGFDDLSLGRSALQACDPHAAARIGCHSVPALQGNLLLGDPRSVTLGGTVNVLAPLRAP